MSGRSVSKREYASRVGQYINRAKTAARVGYDLYKEYQKYKSRNPAPRRRYRTRYRRLSGYINRGLRLHTVNRRKKLTWMGVGAANDRCVVKNDCINIAGVNSRVQFQMLNASFGLGDLSTRDLVYTQSGFSDDDNSVVQLSESVVYTLKNQGDMGCYLTLYTVRLTRDIVSTMDSGSLNNMIATGFSESGGSNSNDQELGVSLYQNNKTKHWIKIIKTQSCYLQPAETKRISLASKKIKRIHFGYKKESEISQRRGALYVIAAVSGIPLHDITFTTTQFATSAPSLDVWCTKKLKFRIPDGNYVPSFSTSTNITAPANAAVGAVEEDIEIDVEEKT